MEEIEKLRRALRYIEGLSQGIDPLTGEVLPEGDIVNNVRVCRCLCYVAEVLRQVEANGGEVGKKGKTPAKAPFAVTDEQMAAISVSAEPVNASSICAAVTAVVGEDVAKITAQDINEWCLSQGLMIEEIYGGKKRRVASDAGRRIGITTTDGVNAQGISYKKNTFDRAAQEFIISRLRDIAALAGK